MANVNGESPNFNFDELEMLGEETAPVEPIAEPAAEQPIGTEREQADTEKPEEGEVPEELAAGEGEKKLGELPVYLEWGGATAISVILLALALLHILYFATAFYVISVGFVGYAIWKGRATNTVYTVILGCALVAVLTAIYCLWLEVGRYQ